MIRMPETAEIVPVSAPDSMEKEILRKHAQQTSSLLDLPPELHVMILQYLPYPDSLSLKITHPYFLDFIQPTHGVAARVTWLLSRAEDGLCIPKSRKLNLKTEQAFLANSEVKTIIRNRRSHEECGQVWMDTNRKRLSRTSWLYYHTDSRLQAPPRCLVDPNIKICTGIQRVMAKQLTVMHMEKRYGSIKHRVAARVSLLSCLPLQMSSQTFIYPAMMASGLVLLEYLAQPLASLTWTEILWVCQSVILGTIISSVCCELVFTRPI